MKTKIRKKGTWKRRTQFLSTNNMPDTWLGPPYTLSHVILLTATHRVIRNFVLQMKHLKIREVRNLVKTTQLRPHSAELGFDSRSNSDSYFRGTILLLQTTNHSSGVLPEEESHPTHFGCQGDSLLLGNSQAQVTRGHSEHMEIYMIFSPSPLIASSDLPSHPPGKSPAT